MKSGQKEKIPCEKRSTTSENSEGNLIEAYFHFEKIFHMLQTIQQNYPEAFSSPRIFKALASDLLMNDGRCKVIIRWLDTSLFEFNALSLLKEDEAIRDNFTRHNLVNKLVNEGAPLGTAKEVIAHLAVLAETII